MAKEWFTTGYMHKWEKLRIYEYTSVVKNIPLPIKETKIFS